MPPPVQIATTANDSNWNLDSLKKNVSLNPNVPALPYQTRKHQDFNHFLMLKGACPSNLHTLHLQTSYHVIFFLRWIYKLAAKRERDAWDEKKTTKKIENAWVVVCLESCPFEHKKNMCHKGITSTGRSFLDSSTENTFNKAKEKFIFKTPCEVELHNRLGSSWN